MRELVTCNQKLTSTKTTGSNEEHLFSEILLNGSDWKLFEFMPFVWKWSKIWKQQDIHLPSYSAIVPGSVQSDLIDNKVIPDPYFELNSKICEWTYQRDWGYMKDFFVPSEWKGRHIRLRFEGIDYSGHFYLNEKFIGKHFGTFRPCEFDVTDALKYGGQNRLWVFIEKAPDEQHQIGYTSLVKTDKPRFAYGWDWSTRLVPLGIWDNVVLIATGDVWIEDAELYTEISEDLSSASVDVKVALRNASSSEEKIALVVEVKQEEETVYCSKFDVVVPHEKHVTQSFAIRSPKLWQPNDLGDQPLYKLRVFVLKDKLISDLKELSFGLRKIRATSNVMSPNGAPPYTIEVNNRKVFIKGWNWVPVDQLYGRINAEKYEKLIKLAKEAHCNLFRVWGGGLMEREVFYDLCDKNGIMIWQEFPLSSSGIDNEPSIDPSYLHFLEDTARAIVKKRRHHPSLVIWGGGNELMTSDGKPLTDKHPTIAMLKKVVLELDPDKIFLPTSPSGPTSFVSLEKIGFMYDVHGDYVYRGVSEHYKLYNGIDPLLHSEFGVEGVASLRSLKKFISDRYLWPPDRTNPVWRHHGEWWINFDKVQELFGKVEDIEMFIFASQLIQYEGLRYIIEANRRRKFHCSGVIPWQFNESWPNASCTSCVDYYGHPKAGYWAVKKAYEPIHISAKYDTIAFYGQNKFFSEIWVSNSFEDIDVAFSAKILNQDGATLTQKNGVSKVDENCSRKLGDFVWTFPEGFLDIFYLLLELRDINGKLLSDNCYVFSTLPEPIFQNLRYLPEWAKKAMGIDER